jgi:exosortase B
MAISTTAAHSTRSSSVHWYLLLAGWAAMYGPTYWDLAGTIWRTDEQFHGAIFLVVIAWLIWDKRLPAVATPPTPCPLAGGLLFGFGLLLYVIGRSQDILIFEVGSQIPVLAGALLFLHGANALRALWFPTLYFVFMVPLPGVLVDAMTGPLKQWVSIIAENLLHAAGYPVARNGVTLSIGQYQLLVADACSGLNSMFSLSALGLLYMYLMPRKSWLHNGIMLASILPIAFAANIVRVIVLILITYHLGDEAGQGFLHGTAGMVLIIVALILIIALDSFSQFVLDRRRLGSSVNTTAGIAAGSSASNEVPEGRTPIADGSALSASATGISNRRNLAFGLMLFIAVVSAIALRPKAISVSAQPNLELLIPKQFGEWTIDQSIIPVLPNPGSQQQLAETYDQTVNRTYINGTGKTIMLSVAYGSRQNQKLKAHRQEVCYAAQGFEIRNLKHVTARISDVNIVVTHMLAVAKQREEPVTYWFTVGNRVVQSHLQRLVAQLQYGLAGTIPDGILVRISSLDSNEQAAYQDHVKFMNEMLEFMPLEGRVRFVGDADRQVRPTQTNDQE